MIATFLKVNTDDGDRFVWMRLLSESQLTVINLQNVKYTNTVVGLFKPTTNNSYYAKIFI